MPLSVRRRKHYPAYIEPDAKSSIRPQQTTYKTFSRLTQTLPRESSWEFYTRIIASLEAHLWVFKKTRGARRRARHRNGDLLVQPRYLWQDNEPGRGSRRQRCLQRAGRRNAVSECRQ